MPTNGRVQRIDANRNGPLTTDGDLAKWLHDWIRLVHDTCTPSDEPL